ERPLVGGEVRCANGLYTSLEEPDRWLTLPRDEAMIHEKMNALREKADRARANEGAILAWASCHMWGLTKVISTGQHGTPVAEWVLKERLQAHELYVPIIKVQSCFSGGSSGDFSIEFTIQGHVWSHYTSRYDQASDSWVKKDDTRDAHENTRILCDAVAAILAPFSGGQVEWYAERNSHRPDLLGDIRERLAASFGPAQGKHGIGKAGGGGAK